MTNSGLIDSGMTNSGLIDPGRTNSGLIDPGRTGLDTGLMGLDPLRQRLLEAGLSCQCHASLKRYNWFRTGGAAELLVEVPSPAVLPRLMRLIPPAVPVTVLGGGSNILIRDGGIGGVVLSLGKFLTGLQWSPHSVTAQAGVQTIHLARCAAERGRAGLEFLVGIPATVGGALAMNAGAYGRELADVFISARAIDRQGVAHSLTAADFDFAYRSSGLADGLVITAVTLATAPGQAAAIRARLQRIRAEREQAQPHGVRTGGSTFKNPPGRRAWELVDQAGCRGLRQGGAQVSEKHCNFLVNHGSATAHDLEQLGERVRTRVKQKTGYGLEWEIRRLGTVAADRETVL